MQPRADRKPSTVKAEAIVRSWRRSFGEYRHPISRFDVCLIMFATMYWMRQIEGNNPLRMDHSREGKTFTSLQNNRCGYVDRGPCRSGTTADACLLSVPDVSGLA